MAKKGYKQDFQALEQCRQTAAKLLAKGMKQEQVPHELHVIRQSVSSVSVGPKAQAIDKEGLRRKPLGSCPGLNPAQRRWLCKLLVWGPQANRFPNDVWSPHRIGQLIEQAFGIAYGNANIWLLLKAMGFPANARPDVPASVMKKRYGTGDSNAGQYLERISKCRLLRCTSLPYLCTVFVSTPCNRHFDVRS